MSKSLLIDMAKLPEGPMNYDYAVYLNAVEYVLEGGCCMDMLNIYCNCKSFVPSSSDTDTFFMVT